jgi:hypothetical protein
MNLLSETKTVVVSNAAAAGVTLITGNTIDMLGFRGIMIIAHLGDNADTAVPELQGFQGDASNGSDAAKLAGTSDAAAFNATSGDNKILILDIEHPMKRYITPKLERNTANIVVQSIIALLYKARDVPVTQGSDVYAATGLYNPDPA